MAAENLNRMDIVTYYNNSFRQACFSTPVMRLNRSPLVISFDEWQKLQRVGRNTPERRAMRLLYRKIGRENAFALWKVRQFAVIGRRGTYCFYKLGAIELHVTEHYGGRAVKTVYSLCVMTKVNMPVGDQLLAAYMTLKDDEEAFLKNANFRSAHIKDEFDDSTMQVFY